jgi:hypothetical protein
MQISTYVGAVVIQARMSQYCMGVSPTMLAGMGLDNRRPTRAGGDMFSENAEVELYSGISHGR